jgi:methylglutaconyl-CoA hydratase
MLDATRYEVTDGVATITLDRPDQRNALSDDLVDSLGSNLERAVADATVRVVVLTNAGNTFCAGADLKAAQPGVAAAGSTRTFVEVFRQIQDAPKPVIGRIDGHATGGGVGLVAVCDLSVMRDDAVLGFTEVRLGVAPAVISVVCLPKLRRADASELFLTGERISASRAVQVGLVNRAVPAGELDGAVDHFVGLVVQGGPAALAAAKELVARVPQLDRDEAFGWTAARSQELFRSPEAAQGIAAFRDRRPAPWVPASRLPPG